MARRQVEVPDFTPAGVIPPGENQIPIPPPAALAAPESIKSENHGLTKIANAFGCKSDVWMNWTLHSPADVIRLNRATSQAERSSNDVVNKELLIEYAYIHSVDVYDETTGAYNGAPRIVLFTEKGETISFVSAGILESMMQFVGFFGVKRWTPPIPVTVRSFECGSNRRILKLELTANKQLPPLVTV